MTQKPAPQPALWPVAEAAIDLDALRRTRQQLQLSYGRLTAAQKLLVPAEQRHELEHQLLVL